MVSSQLLLLCAITSAAGETVLLEFTSDSCPACKTAEGPVRQLQVSGYPIRQINISRNPQWASMYRVRSVPSFVMISNGQIVDRVVGFEGTERLLQMFQAARFTPGGTHSKQMRGQSPDQAGGNPPLPEFLSKRSSAPSPPETRGHDVAPASAERLSAPAAEPRPAVRSPSHGHPEQLAARATVRLKVEDPRGYSFGTGTIIDTHGSEALVITCGHIFRDSRGKGRITVDLFVDGTPRSVPGQLVSYDADTKDIGLVTLRPGVPVTPVPVAPSKYVPRRGSRVFSIGCNNGRPPSLMRSQITSVDRYAGPSNIEVAGMPVNGRSGGGLFTSDGMLIGVCNAADDQDNEGIYAALAVVHDHLDEAGQSRVYQRAEQSLAAAADRTGRTGRTRSLPVTSTEATAAASSPEDVEIIFIVRSRSNRLDRPRTFVVENPSAQLLNQLEEFSQSDSADAEDAQSLAGSRRSQPWPQDATSRGPVVRGQSRDR